MRVNRRDLLKGLSRIALATLFPAPMVETLLGVPEAAAQPLPRLARDFGNGRRVAVIGAGIAGLTSAYELLKAGFDVTVFEGQKRYGGRSLTVRPSDPDYRDWYLANNSYVRRDSYCDFVPAEVGGAMLPEQSSQFVPVRNGDGYFDLHFNAGPGRIPTNHTGVLHYCREFGVELIPYIFVCGANLLQADDFNNGRPVQIRQFLYDIEGYLAQILSEASTQANSANVPISEALLEKLRNFLVRFGDLSPSGIFTNTNRAGYSIQPGAGPNGGRLRAPIPLQELLKAESLWDGLLAGTERNWQLPLLEPAGGMDMIWQAFLAQRIGEAELRAHVRLEHEVSGMNYSDASAERITVSYKAPNGHGEETFDYVIMTGKPFNLVDMDTANLLDAGVRNHLDSILYFMAGKYSWQSRTRFWENDNVGIFGGISWTDHLIRQIWYPSSGYHTPTGVLTGAYMVDVNSVDRSGKAYPADMDYKVAVDPQDLPSSQRRASRWAAMDQATRTRMALAGGKKLHPGIANNVYQESGLSVSWNNQPFQFGLMATNMPTARPDAYARLIRAIDRSGRLYMAGDSISFLSGWQEGAVRSAWWTLGLIRDHVVAQPAAQ